MLQDLASRTPHDIESDSIRMRAIPKDHCKGKNSKPWDLQPNGDLKHMLFKFLRAKGPHSVAFCKVRGHATDEDVQEGGGREEEEEEEGDAEKGKGVEAQEWEEEEKGEYEEQEEEMERTPR